MSAIKTLKRLVSLVAYDFDIKRVGVSPILQALIYFIVNLFLDYFINQGPYLLLRFLILVLIFNFVHYFHYPLQSLHYLNGSLIHNMILICD